MARRFLLPAASIAVAAMCACSSPPATPLPDVRVTQGTDVSSGVRTLPGGTGSTFVFKGTLVQTGTSSATVRESVVQTITVRSTPYPYGNASNALDYHSVEVDRNGSTSSSWIADVWRGAGAVKNGRVPTVLYGSHEQDGNGDAFTYRYPVPLIVGWATASGAQSWSNGGALNYEERDVDGVSARAMYAADGAYQETIDDPQACWSSASCALDVAVRTGGSAQYSGSALQAQGVSSIALGGPAGGFISIVYDLENGYPQAFEAPAWFSASSALYAETDELRTVASLPPACKPAMTSSRNAGVVTRRITRIDPAAGVRENESTQTYASPAYGTLCVVLDDRQSRYYDFSTGNFSGVPIATAATTETLWLASETAANGSELQRAPSSPGEIGLAVRPELRRVGRMYGRPYGNPTGATVSRRRP